MAHLSFLLIVGVVPVVILAVLCQIYRDTRLRRIVALWVSLTYIASVAITYLIARGPGLVVLIFLTSYLVQLFGPILHVSILKYSNNTIGEGRFAGMLFGSILLFLVLVFVAAGVGVRVT